MTAPSENGLRPSRLADFGGQADVTRQLGIILRGALAREELCDHLLLTGPPGLGKTTLAGIVANELGVELITTSGPAISHAGELAAILTGLTGPTVVFVDEIHRLDRNAEELIYPALEDGVLDLTVGEEAIRLPLEPFCLIGATTQAGLLTAPLRDRFGHIAQLEPYGLEDLTRIVERSAGILNIDIDTAGCEVVARRSRGTPRVANRLLRRVRDWADDTGTTTINAAAAAEALDAFGIDARGLDRIANRLLQVLCQDFGGGPVGIDNLAKIVDVHPSTIEEVYEPQLIREKLLVRTSRGRMATGGAYEHLGMAAPAQPGPVRRRVTSRSSARPGKGQAPLL